MKVTVKLPVPQNASIVVDIGDKITQNSHYAVFETKNTEKIIHLSRLLRIPPQDIQKYLVVKIGEKIHPGETIAQKKTFLKTAFIRSPVEGSIKEIDFKKGIMVINGTLEDESPGKVTSPVAGKIIKINANDLELELEGMVLNVLDGWGEDVWGEMISFGKDSVEMFDLTNETKDKIILCRDITESALTKADVLQIKGMILIHPNVLPGLLSWVNVDDEVFKKIGNQKGTMVWLRVAYKQLVILE